MERRYVLMRFKRFCAMLLVCALLGCAAAPAGAIEDNAVVPFAFGSLNHRIGKNDFIYVGQSINLNKGNKVSFDCDYVPTSASVDFGVVAPDGKFYSLNSTSGHINKSIEVSQRGQYTIVIRNNESYEITVAGGINY